MNGTGVLWVLPDSGKIFAIQFARDSDFLQCLSNVFELEGTHRVRPHVVLLYPNHKPNV